MSNPVNPVVRFNNVILMYPHVYQPQAMRPTADNPSPTPAYSMEILIDPVANADDWKAFQQTVLALAEEKWPGQGQKVLELVASDRKLRCYGKGEEKVNRTTMETKDGYAGRMYLSGRDTKFAPVVYDDKAEKHDPSNALSPKPKFYSGCIVNCGFSLWLQDNQHGRAIRCSPAALQFVKDGTPIGGHAPVADDFFAPVAGAPEPTASGFEPEEEPQGGPISFL